VALLYTDTALLKCCKIFIPSAHPLPAMTARNGAMGIEVDDLKLVLDI
jgi:hypothetical protein